MVKYRNFLIGFEQAELEIKEFWIEEFKKGDTDTTATIESVAGKPILERKTIRRKSPNASKWLAMRYPEEFGASHREADRRQSGGQVLSGYRKTARSAICGFPS